ncbi:Lrp/AsnC family transcriptional regulator [Tianweitania sediminis]|uniref:Lrp/AsnC family transcriptional regulator n=1 Tax=Tianweitania sediminis TaxID=1502156 RepID=A0A8J7QVS7_9HYPH|nr:Lrp/AsnC family transcriptional regulator [Tianweitania sediminis]MBP0437348.1 Lrp/AsnC family transcriptional regulator [Tianweitania sediminis]
MDALDAIDHRILRELRADGRISTVDLASRVGLSPTPCARRVKRLEDAGVIQGYTAKINPAALGLAICVMVSVRLGKQGPEGAGEFLREVSKHPEITECLLVTGNIDYLLRVWVKDIPALRDFISNVLQSIPSVAETSTMVVLNLS